MNIETDKKNTRKAKSTKRNAKGESKDNNANPTSDKAAPKTAKTRPPPIYANITGIKTVITFLTSNGIAANEFTVKEFDESYSKVIPNNMDAYTLYKKQLEKQKIQYFTYTPRHLKVKTVALKGVRGGYDEIDVKNALIAFNLPNTTITKVSKLIFDKTKPHLYHFLVSASADSNLAMLMRQKTLLSQIIRWERLKRPALFMCTRCQQTGHSSANCNMEPACAKCAGPHETKTCTVVTATDKTAQKCINCGEKDHPASYKGCPALKLVAKVRLNKRKIDEARRKKIMESINNYVTPTQSFANITDNTSSRHFPSLPKARPTAAGVNFNMQNPRTEPASTTTRQNLGNDTSHLENLLISFKNDIVKEFKKLNEKVNSNSSRIDQIMAATDRPNSTKGGGTAIAIHNKLKFTTIHYPHSLKNKVIEYTAIKIKISNKANLIIISIYATQKYGQTFINELNKLMREFKLDNASNYYLIAGDFNTKHISWGDVDSNNRGDQLVDWLEANYLQYKISMIPPSTPTFHNAKIKSYLDHCLIDMRIDVEDLINGKLITLPYDSDHWAISLTIFIEVESTDFTHNQDSNRKALNYKKANWNKFGRNLLDNYTDECSVPYDRNLSIEEIDNHIIELENKIVNSIQATVPTIKKKDDYFIKYSNRKINKLHAYKSFLIRRKFKNIPVSSQEKIKIKAIIKRINTLIQREFKKTVTAYWEAQVKSINYKKPQDFFPKINRMLRQRKEISINTLKINNDNSQLNSHFMSKFPELVNNNQLIATDADTKLYIIESINAPRYSNLGTINKIDIDKVAEQTKKLKDNMRLLNKSFVEFSNTNRAYYPTNQDDDSRFLFSYIAMYKFN
ncbi:Similar to ORF1: Nucleic-acid-binding protein from transposon X-element (Drosophila melanogaster) [Cotesia congregata]|uniref:Similar to ORF1: Nucleic-acid-binding protein from transposon X-element (Drosophila melanogaster) n=1 Tax=Cotesia congregata TaxID=51543 RepID=A0A8J2H9R7_COTCN|nr:Similar to ORF1: Nucleic-acid-binding protein from transposon X-element (Drosophila melanogaster) [Cotesia congregata]